MSEDNWEIVKEKAQQVFNALEEYGYYDTSINSGRGARFTPEMLADESKKFWRDVMEKFNGKYIPAYDKECQYCDHSEYCPVNQGTLGGLNSLIDDESDG